MSDKILHEINLDDLENIAGGVAINELDTPHRDMLNFLMKKLDRKSFEELLKGIADADDIDEARRLIELPYGVHAGH